jgi:nucleotide-binding universal stress UspA family protein
VYPHLCAINQKQLFIMKKILIPVDFSDTSLNAFHVACQMANRIGAKVYVLNVNETVANVAPMAEYAYVDIARTNEAAERELMVQLENLRDELLYDPQFEGLDVEILLRDGLVLPVIRQISTEEDIDLIVMGTLGASGLKEIIVGSNTERIIRYADCPVLVIPEGVKELKVKKALVPTTLKADQEKVFNLAKHWQHLLDFKMETLYLNNPLNASTDGEIEAEKKRMAERVGLEKDLFLYIFGDTLNEDNAILSYAQHTDADLIIMGTHQRRGLSHMLFGSLTEDTANHTHIPMLAVPIR